MYPLFRDVAGPYQRALWVKYVLHTHIIAFIIKSNWKLSQNLHTWTTQYVHFQCGIYWPKPVVLASSSTSISSKWNIYQNSSYFTLRRLPVPWQQYYVPLCVVPSGLYSRYVNSDVNYDMVVPLIRTSCINEEYIPNWSSLEYTYAGVSRCINMWNLLTLTSWVVPWSIVDI